MRSEKEMFDLLISTAREDENILAAYLEGSRTVPGVPKDIFQDYDLVYVVKENQAFYRRPEMDRPIRGTALYAVSGGRVLG